MLVSMHYLKPVDLPSDRIAKRLKYRTFPKPVNAENRVDLLSVELQFKWIVGVVDAAKSLDGDLLEKVSGHTSTQSMVSKSFRMSFTKFARWVVLAAPS